MSVQLFRRCPCRSHSGARASLAFPDFGAAGKRAAFATVIYHPSGAEGAKLNVLCLLGGCPSSLPETAHPNGLPPFIPKSTYWAQANLPPAGSGEFGC